MMANTPKVRILIADDHILVAAAFAKLLEPEFEVVGQVADGRALLEDAPKLKPDVVILDLGMPLLNGLEAGERIKEVLPNVKIIVLTVGEDSEVAAEVLHRWASGFLLKKSAASELIKAVREVSRGNSYVTPFMTKKLVDKFIRDPRAERVKILTPRQREVLQLLVEGHTMKEVAEVLNVTPRTVAFHKYRIMEEFGLKTNSELFLLAIREHVIAQP